MRITADVIDEEPCIGCSDSEQSPPKCEKRLRLVVKGNPKAKSARQYRFMFNTMLKKFKQLDVSDSFFPISEAAANRKLFSEIEQTDAMASKDSTSAASTQNADQEWLAEELSKMKKEITKDVTRNVLHHLMGSLRNTQDSITKEVDDSSVHKGIYCDNCDQIICGVRYKCGNCSDYDLCEVCENIPDVHDGNHIFLKIRNPMPQQAKPKRRRKKVAKTPVYASCGDMHVTIDMAPPPKSALGKLAAERYRMNAKFLHDVTIPDGSVVAPGSQFLKSWKVMNSGVRPWTRETCVNYMSGSSLLKPAVRKLEVPKLLPGEEGIVSVAFRAPLIPGTYQSHWGFVHKEEETFGDRIWCLVLVQPYQSVPSFISHMEHADGCLASRMFTSDISDDLNNSSFLVCKANEVKESTDEANKESVPGNKQALEEAAVKQSEPNVTHVADVLNAVHEVQERGELMSRKLAASSYTATPNNTPFDLSPPKSPEPQDPGSKDIQLGAVGDIVGAVSTQGKQSKTVITGVENEDKSSCISLSSSESDAEFVVIPMPKCFTFGEILSPEIVQPVAPERDLQTGHFTEMKLEENVSATTSSCQNVKEPETESSEESAAVGETRNLSIETTVKLIENKGLDSKDGNVIVSQITVDCSSPEFSVIDSESQTPEVEVLTPEAEIATVADADEDQTVHVENSAIVNCSVECLSNQESTTEEQTEPELESEEALESSGTYPKVPMSTVSAGQTTPRQEERTIQVLPEGLVTGALSAAASVYNTARAVISSIQVRNDQSQETDVPQSEGTLVPPMATMDPMQQLIEMGFCNRPKNEQLLQQHNGDVAVVVAQLVSMNDNDWYASRHSVGSGMTDFD